MIQQDVTLLQLARQIQLLSLEVALIWFRGTPEVAFSLRRIRKWANALVPRTEANWASR